MIALAGGICIGLYIGNLKIIQSISTSSNNPSMLSGSPSPSNTATASYKSVSVKDLAQHPSDYVGMQISVKSELTGALGLGSYVGIIQSSDGYNINLAKNCFESTCVRDYHYYVEYTAQGTWTQDNRLNCSEPLI